MYEEMTFDVIMDRMLDRIDDEYDKREGSIIYDALAPAAYELAQMYIEFDAILNEAFADTASREYLIRRAAERGLTPTEATHAVLQGVFTPTTLTASDLVGQRFNIDDLNFVVTEPISEALGTYQVRCETAGAEGHQHLGTILPIDYIDGLETATLTDVLIPGEDEEDTEVFRERYFASFESKAYGGNVDDYLEKTNSIAGVGSTKVTPVWNGGGTVKLTILNSEYEKASSTLINTVQQEIDPTQDGTGIGIAPIGHIVTVTTVDNVTVNISTSITFQEGYSWNTLKEVIEAAVEEYMLSLRTTWADEPYTIVRISQIETKIMNVTGVLDIQNTAINGVAENLVLDAYEIPILGVITNE